MPDGPNVVLITGAAGGIGQALCREFKKNGYLVIATDRIESSGLACDRFVKTDLQSLCRDQKSLQKFVMAVDIPETGLTALVNNAAVQILNKTPEISRQNWYDTLEVNLLAPFLLTQAFLPALERAGGSVINIGSVHAVATKPGFVCYATSKAALVGLTRALAVDLGGRVRVNAVNPAAVATLMLREGFRNKEERLATLAGMHPVGRIAEPEEVAQAVVFLASSGASFITGTTFNVDGGILSRLHDPE